jgi:hypothetical protein
MSKSNRLSLISMMLVLITILGAWTVRVRANYGNSVDLLEKEQIKQTVQAYFDLRYRSHYTLLWEDFGTLVEESPQGINFLHSEADK